MLVILRNRLAFIKANQKKPTQNCYRLNFRFCRQNRAKVANFALQVIAVVFKMADKQALIQQSLCLLKPTAVTHTQ